MLYLIYQRQKSKAKDVEVIELAKNTIMLNKKKTNTPIKTNQSDTYKSPIYFKEELNSVRVRKEESKIMLKRLSGLLLKKI